MILTNAKIVTEIKVILGTIYLEGNKIKKITNKIDKKGIDLKGKYVLPGFIDLHTHGGYGYDFMDGKHPKLNEYIKCVTSEGVTTVVRTTMTQTKDNIKKALNAIRDVNNQLFKFAHIEGPFISKNKCGAQDPALIVTPSVKLFDELNSSSGNQIKICTTAIENDENFSFTKNLLKRKVVVSLGHTSINHDTAFEAFEKHKVNHVTHFFNAMTQFTHQDPGAVAAVFNSRKPKVELICDGIHVNKNIIKATYGILGFKNIMLITDSMRAKGLKDGDYEIGGQKVIKKGMEARLEKNNALAGSVATFDYCFKNIIKFTNCSIIEAS